jgi:RNA polymerase sigma-70 factor, ECF subfamily
MVVSDRLGRRTRLRALADEDLMSRANEGDSRAFEVIVDRHGDASFSLAYRMCGQRALAEDVVQEAFLSVWRSSARYDYTRGSVRSWVLAAVHNRAIDALRRGVVRRERDIEEETVARTMAAPDATEVEVIRREESLVMRGVLQELPREQRQAIELAYFAGFTQSEIAEMLGLPIGTVKGRMRLGLTKLRLILDNQPAVAR